MEEKDFNDIKKLIAKLIDSCHMTALKGLAPHETMRGIATNLEIKYAEKEAVHEENHIQKLDEKVQKHFVVSAESQEYAALKDILKAVRNFYRAAFNGLVIQRVDALELEHFVMKVLKNPKLPDDAKKEIAQSLLKIVEEFHSELVSIHKAANDVYATAKGRGSVALAMTKLLHTSGPSFMKRKNEQSLFKEGHKDAVKAADIEEDIYKMHFKSREEFDKLVKKHGELMEHSFADYTKLGKLLFSDWEAVLKDLEKEGAIVAKATEEHELPALDKGQMEEITGLIVEKIMEPFVHSLNQGVNQLDAIRSDIAGLAGKMD